MTLVAKNIYAIAVLAAIITGCNTVPDIHVITGEAQGTTFSIKYLGENKISKHGVDSLLELMDVEMNSPLRVCHFLSLISTKIHQTYLLFSDILDQRCTS